MLFEKQDYQYDCVTNITNILEECDVFNSDYSNLTRIMKEHYKTQKYSQFETSNKKQIDILMETGTGKTFIAFQIAWKLFKSRWNMQRDGKRQPRILFLVKHSKLD